MLLEWDKAKIDLSKPCVYHKNKPNKNGYVHARFGGPKEYVHRYAWEAKYGLIPKHLQLDHMCNNKACMEPDHLALCTAKENMQRQEQFNRSTCAQGHPWTPENTGYKTYLGCVSKYCNACNKDRCRERYHREKA